VLKLLKGRFKLLQYHNRLIQGCHLNQSQVNQDTANGSRLIIWKSGKFKDKGGGYKGHWQRFRETGKKYFQVDQRGLMQLESMAKKEWVAIEERLREGKSALRMCKSIVKTLKRKSKRSLKR
jgi:hypothetical protein